MPALDYKEISKRLPQRFPFLLVDKILEVNKNEAIGVKNVSLSDQNLQGHFPERPIFPGVLLVEACAQVGGVMIAEHEEYQKRGYIAMIDNFKFIDFILPGDAVIIHCELINMLGKFVKARVEAKVEDNIVGKGIITYNFEK